MIIDGSILTGSKGVTWVDSAAIVCIVLHCILLQSNRTNYLHSL